MTAVVALVAGAIALLVLQRAVGVGLPRRAFGIGEAFVLGHWPFLFLGAALLLLTGGRDWASLDGFEPAAVRTAAAIVAGGLAAFVAGCWLGSVPAGRVVGGRNHEASVAGVLPVALAMTAVGAAAAVLNAPVLSTVAWAERSGALLVAAELLVPAAALAAVIAFRRGYHWAGRAAALAALVVAIGLMTTGWSRRPLIVACIAVMLVVPTVRRGWLPRRLLLLLVPVMLLLAVGAFFWRYEVWHPGTLDPGVRRDAAGLASTYSRSLWLETSSFSALVLVVEEYGLTSFKGGGSLAMPLLFWVPRSVFPAKPVAFELGEMLGTPYSIPPSIYGEVLVNLTVVGLVPFMAALGFLARRIDRAGTSSAISDGARAIYLVLVLDAVFVPRGSFHTMVMPMVVHGLVPLAALRALAAARSVATAVLSRRPPPAQPSGGGGNSGPPKIR